MKMIFGLLVGLVLIASSMGAEVPPVPPTFGVQPPSPLKAVPYVHYINKQDYWWQHFEASKTFAVGLMQANPKMANDEITHRAYNLADELMQLHGYVPATEEAVTKKEFTADSRPRWEGPGGYPSRPMCGYSSGPCFGGSCSGGGCCSGGSCSRCGY